jgi:hypothetical protein
LHPSANGQLLQRQRVVRKFVAMLHKVWGAFLGGKLIKTG